MAEHVQPTVQLFENQQPSSFFQCLLLPQQSLAGNIAKQRRVIKILQRQPVNNNATKLVIET
jgi:hypothetical protein